MSKAKSKAAAKAGKVRVDLRIDPELMDAVQDLADRSGLSVNQLVGGIVRGVVPWAHVGLADELVAPDGTAEEVFVLDCEPGAVWFGDEGYEPVAGGGVERVRPTSLWFGLDYRGERNVISRKQAVVARQARKDKRQ